MKTTELELTYLAKYIPKGLDKCRKERMTDLYIPKPSSHPVIRIRKIGDLFEITKKSPVNDGDASRQDEHTISLTREEYDALSRVNGKKLSKTRFYFDHNGVIAHVDVFHGRLKGLVLIDFEFENQEQMDAFTMPDFCLADVTHDEAIAGGLLAGKRFQDIKKHLDQYNYLKQAKKTTGLNQ